MNAVAVATHSAIEAYRKSRLCRALCGAKPFGSRHWEYPWAVEQSGLLEHSGSRVLDIAPDLTFPYARFLQSLGHRVFFIDLEQKAWSDKVVWGLDPQAASGNFAMMDARRMAFPDEAFDSILCVSVLEHIVCPTQDPDHPRLDERFDPLAARTALREMRRCLKPGGRLLLTVDIYQGEKWKPWFDRWDIAADILACGFTLPAGAEADLEHDRLLQAPDVFLSDFHGPYLTLGFSLNA